MPASTFDTHDVLNQPPPFPVVNAVESDPVLVGAIDHALDPESEAALLAHATYWGSLEAREWARLAVTTRPHLNAYDAQGRRIDQIDYHPAYHALMRRSTEAGLGQPPVLNPRAPRHGELLRAARLFVTAQTEPAHLLALSTTRAGGALLQEAGGDAFAPWLTGIASRRYDHRALPVGQKSGVSLALGLTEKQGGVEPLDASTTADAGPAGLHRILGHKWFVASPSCDGTVLLAETPGGPSAFLVPRLREDGSANAIRLQRLKDTLGLTAAAIGEMDYARAEAMLIGGEGAGPMLLSGALSLLRLDSVIIAAGQMRAALAHAVHHCRHREVSGERLIDLDLMTRVLADMTLDVAAATVLAMRLASARDRALTDPAEAAYLRLVLPAAKFWVSRIGIAIAAEALECTGGNGFVETGVMPRFYRDAPAQALWAGPGNVLGLELIATLGDDPRQLDMVLDDILGELGQSSAVSAEVIRAAAVACQEDRGSARILAEQLALAAAAAALHRYSPRAITDAFLDTRLAGPWRSSYGMLDGRYDSRGIVDYAFHGL